MSMLTMNSISGGKTSAYMAYHLPADLNVFAVVCSNNPITRLKDPGLEATVKRRLMQYDSRYGEFVGTKEDEKTLKAVLDLEQMLGREISWVRGETYEEMVMRKSLLPNTEWRICTTELKMRPIAEWIYNQTGGGKVFNRVGIRIDEAGRMKSPGHRAQRIDVKFHWYEIARDYGRIDNGVGLIPKSKWVKEYEFAEASYPLIEDEDGRIKPHRKADIYKWAANSGIVFPESSNCQDCFHKSASELMRNAKRNPHIFEAGAQMEEAFSAMKSERTGRAKEYSMKKGFPLRKIINAPYIEQPDLFTYHSDMEKLSYCESTFCTD